MDGKYAKYIQNFMKSFKINGEKVEIQTMVNEKKQPLIYDLNKETIEGCNNKLDMQYQIITDNEESIEKNETRKIEIFAVVLWAVFIITAILSSLTTITLPATLVSILKAVAILSAPLAGLGLLTSAIKKINFMNLIHIVKDYKKNRKAIEEEMKDDENITKYLSKETHQLLSEKTKLVAAGKTSEILDMDFMDKLLDKKAKGRKELINLLSMYKAVISLREEPKYIAPVEKKENASKKRSRKKEENK